MAASESLTESLRQGVVILVLLIAADLAFAAIHLLHTLSDVLPDPRFSLAHDLGYAEIFQYVKIFWVVFLLAALGWRVRQPVYGAWTALYAYLLADDALQFHELGGAAIANVLGYIGRFGLRAVDYGELTISAGVGFVMFIAILLSYLRSSRDARHASQDLVLLLAALVFFGVGVDMLHAVAGKGALGIVLGLMEDGGEMVVISVTVWYMLALLACRGERPQPLWQWARLAWMTHRAGARRQADGLGRPAVDPAGSRDGF